MERNALHLNDQFGTVELYSEGPIEKNVGTAPSAHSQAGDI